jgi:3-oxoacyl-(acyl-carrier-protein) synthase
LRRALDQAGIGPEQVDYINAHGTGTRDNDLAEGRMLRRVFGDGLPPVSSTKRVFGHTLGAAGAIEAVVSVLALQHGLCLGNVGLTEPDPQCEFMPWTETRTGSVHTVVSNSFGFGGNNTVLCFRRE